MDLTKGKNTMFNFSNKSKGTSQFELLQDLPDNAVTYENIKLLNMVLSGALLKAYRRRVLEGLRGIPNKKISRELIMRLVTLNKELTEYRAVASREILKVIKPNIDKLSEETSWQLEFFTKELLLFEGYSDTIMKIIELIQEENF